MGPPAWKYPGPLHTSFVAYHWPAYRWRFIRDRQLRMVTTDPKTQRSTENLPSLGADSGLFTVTRWSGVPLCTRLASKKGSQMYCRPNNPLGRASHTPIQNLAVAALGFVRGHCCSAPFHGLRIVARYGMATAAAQCDLSRQRGQKKEKNAPNVPKAASPEA